MLLIETSHSCCELILSFESWYNSMARFHIKKTAEFDGLEFDSYLTIDTWRVGLLMDEMIHKTSIIKKQRRLKCIDEKFN